MEGPSQEAMRPESSLRPRLSAVTVPPTVDVLGVELALTDYEEMLDWIEAMASTRTRGYLCTP